MADRVVTFFRRHPEFWIAVLAVAYMLVIVVGACWSYREGTEKARRDAYDQGRQAARVGIEARANPYVGDSWDQDRGRWWLAGYLEGKEKK